MANNDPGKAAARFTSQVGGCMKQRRVTRAELARRLGVSRAAVTRLLSGKSNPTIRTMAALTEALECDLVIEVRPRGTPPDRGPETEMNKTLMKK